MNKINHYDYLHLNPSYLFPSGESKKTTLADSCLLAIYLSFLFTPLLSAPPPPWFGKTWDH